MHAQRKFAQGSPTFAFISKENVFTNHHLPLTNSAAVSDMANDVMLDKCPKTEDFLSFLCFRGSDLLPESLGFFADPVLHNYPNGRPASPDLPKAAATNNSAPSKSDGKPNEAKQAEAAAQSHSSKTAAAKAAQPKKEKNSKKPVIISQKNQKLSVSRIHSNFRKTAATPVRVLTRRDQGKPMASGLTPKKKPAANNKTSKSKSKPSEVKRKIATRLQRRANQTASESSSSSSSNESESSSSEDSESSEPSSSPPVLRNKASGKTTPKSAKSDKAKESPKKVSIAVGKITRQSSKTVSSPPRATRKMSSGAAPALKDLPTPRRQSAPASNSKSPAASPMTREAARKLKSSPAGQLLTRRPTRRTKEAATFYMTLIGQEEELDSSEMEEQSSKTESKQNANGNKTTNKKKAPASVESKRRPPTPPSPPGIRTRRSKSGASSVPSSPQVKLPVCFRYERRLYSYFINCNSNLGEETCDFARGGQAFHGGAEQQRR